MIHQEMALKYFIPASKYLHLVEIQSKIHGGKSALRSHSHFVFSIGPLITKLDLFVLACFISVSVYAHQIVSWHATILDLRHGVCCVVP